MLHRYIIRYIKRDRQVIYMHVFIMMYMRVWIKTWVSVVNARQFVREWCVYMSESSMSAASNSNIIQLLINSGVRNIARQN